MACNTATGRRRKALADLRNGEPELGDPRCPIVTGLGFTEHFSKPKDSWEQLPEPAALPRLGEIAMPTLIIVGEHDIPDVHAHAGAIEAGIRGSRRIVLAGSGHLPQLEVPDSFNQSVLEFLSTVP